jgi:hypothetical protein
MRTLDFPAYGPEQRKGAAPAFDGPGLKRLTPLPREFPGSESDLR